MYVEPVVHQHVDVMLALTRSLGRGDGLEPATVARELALDSATVANRLRNLAAAGLLHAEAGDRAPRYRLARPADAITLAEISDVAESRDARAGMVGLGDGGRDRASAGVASLSASIAACAQRLMSSLTLADLVEAPGSFDERSPPRRLVVEPGPAHEGGPASVDPVVVGQWAREGRPPLVIDVRREPGLGPPAPTWARWIPLERVPVMQSNLPRYQPIVTVCAQGARSEMAAQYLRSIGFGRAYALRGGLAAWHRTDPLG